MGIKGIPKNHPRHHSSITPRLIKPSEHTAFIIPLAASTVVKGMVPQMPVVHWPCDNAKEGGQPQPSASNPIPKRQIQGGM
jgi:hypothetical protein